MIIKRNKKTSKRLAPLEVDGNYFKNILYTNHTTKQNLLQRLLKGWVRA